MSRAGLQSNQALLPNPSEQLKTPPGLPRQAPSVTRTQPYHTHTNPHQIIPTTQTTTTVSLSPHNTNPHMRNCLGSFFLGLSAHPQTRPPATRLPSPTLSKAHVQHPVAQNWVLSKKFLLGQRGRASRTETCEVTSRRPSPHPPPSPI